MTLTRIEDHAEAFQRDIDALLDRVNGSTPEPAPALPTEREVRERQFWFLIHEVEHLNDVLQNYRRDMIAMVASVCFVFLFVGSLLGALANLPWVPIVAALVTGALTPLTAWLFYHREM